MSDDGLTPCPAAGATRWQRFVYEHGSCYDTYANRGHRLCKTWTGRFGAVFVAVIIAGVIGFGFAIAFLVVRPLSWHYEHEACINYATQTDREVRWVELNYWEFDCYVRWNDRWVPKDSFTRLTFGQETGEP